MSAFLELHDSFIDNHTWAYTLLGGCNDKRAICYLQSGSSAASASNVVAFFCNYIYNM